jgi:hypothetical protein
LLKNPLQLVETDLEVVNQQIADWAQGNAWKVGAIHTNDRDKIISRAMIVERQSTADDRAARDEWLLLPGAPSPAGLADLEPTKVEAHPDQELFELCRQCLPWHASRPSSR